MESYFAMIWYLNPGCRLAWLLTHPRQELCTENRIRRQSPWLRLWWKWQRVCLNDLGSMAMLITDIKWELGACLIYQGPASFHTIFFGLSGFHPSLGDERGLSRANIGREDRGLPLGLLSKSAMHAPRHSALAILSKARAWERPLCINWSKPQCGRRCK